MMKREPVQVSSEELEGDNTELEQKQLLRNELTSEEHKDERVSSDATEDDDSTAK